MNEVNKFECVDGEKVDVLSKLLEKNGCCSMTGYLGVANMQLAVDDNGVVEFVTETENDDFIIKSQGAIISDGVVIKQVQTGASVSFNQLFAWDIDDNSYTYIVFDNPRGLNDCYEKLKNFNVNLTKEDISSKFMEMNISFNDVAQILLDQKVDTVASMVEEAVTNASDDTSFVL